MNRILIAAAVLAGAAFGASAQTTAEIVQRDASQQQRIEQGLRQGTLTTREGAGLERQQARIDHMEQRDLRDGSISPREQARITRTQNAESRAIRRAKGNGVDGHPMSASSRREQQEVQRNINQENRIHEGVASGKLTNREVAHLEGREARIDRQEYRAGADGHVGRREQARVNAHDDRVSRHIHDQKHDIQARP